MILFIIYLVGCVFSYLRTTASMYEIEERYIETISCDIPNYGNRFIHTITLLSWFGYLAGVIIYLLGEEKYFFKTSFKKLNNYKRENN